MTEQPAKPHEVDSSTNENSADGNKPRKTWQDPSLFSENEVQVSYISGSFLGIAIAGGAYAVCLGGITILFDQIVSSTGIGSLFEIALSHAFLFADRQSSWDVTRCTKRFVVDSNCDIYESFVGQSVGCQIGGDFGRQPCGLHANGLGSLYSQSWMADIG